MKDYLDTVVRQCCGCLGPTLSGVVLYGSQAQGESVALSDVDILVLVDGALSVVQRKNLAAQFSHTSLPVPAKGLELMVIQTSTALHLPSPLIVDFALTTGETWPTEVQAGEEYEDLLLDIAVARENGRALFGPPPKQAFAEPPRDRLLNAIERALEWHRPRLLDPIHDPQGQNSVLNAARAWRFVEEGAQVSKVQGGRWAERKTPFGRLVTQALAIRTGDDQAALDATELDAFLLHVIGLCRASASAARQP